MAEKSVSDQVKKNPQDDFQASAHAHLSSILERAQIPSSTQNDLRNQFFVYCTHVENVPKDAKAAVSEFLSNYASTDNSQLSRIIAARNEMTRDDQKAKRAAYDNAIFNASYSETMTPTLASDIGKGLRANAERREAQEKAVEESVARHAARRAGPETGRGTMAGITPSQTERPTTANISITVNIDSAHPHSRDPAHTADLTIHYTFYKQRDDEGRDVMVACPENLTQTRVGNDRHAFGYQRFRDNQTMGAGEFKKDAEVSGPIEITYNDNKYLLYLPSVLGITPENYDSDPLKREFVDNYMQQINNQSINAKPLRKSG